VVDHEKGERLSIAFEPRLVLARSRGYLGDVEGRLLLDPHRDSVSKLAGGLDNALRLFLIEVPAGYLPVGWVVGTIIEQEISRAAIGKLTGRHLLTEKQRWVAGTGRTQGNAKGKGCLAHAGAPGEDYQVPAL
jgi:hypothetical protein